MDRSEDNAPYSMRKDEFMSKETKSNQRPIIPPVDEIKEMHQRFIVPDDKILMIMETFRRHMREGLKHPKDRTFETSLKMLPSYIFNTFYARNDGIFISLDLGGTNLRFQKVSIVEKMLSSEKSEIEIPQSAMVGESDALFGFIAKFLEESLVKFEIKKDTLIPYCGFTFSFPMEQEHLCHGKLITWTKGYNVSGVENEDVCQLLLKACQKRGMRIERFAIVNDTVGTLLCGAMNYKNVSCGIINGTGSNACYIEELDLMPKYTGDRAMKNEMVINIEWGAFGDHGEIDEVITEFDRMLDQQSLRPHVQTFEKMISGMYLGELVRLILLQLIAEKKLFDGVVPEKMKVKDSFETRLISLAYNLPQLKNAIDTEFGTNITKKDGNIISCICDVIAFRGAQFLAAAIACLINRVNKVNQSVAVDGSMFTKHPMFMNYSKDLCKKYLETKDYRLVLADDGSGRGAAIAAAVAQNFDVRLGELKDKMGIPH